MKRPDTSIFNLICDLAYPNDKRKDSEFNEDLKTVLGYIKWLENKNKSLREENDLKNMVKLMLSFRNITNMNFTIRG